MTTCNIIEAPPRTRYADKAIIKFFAQGNWRGVPTLDVVCQLQSTRDRLEQIQDCPFILKESIPSGCSFDEYVEDTVYNYQCVIDALQNELERRRTLNTTPNTNTDREIIQVIKDRVPLADVLEWYTQVIYENKERLRFHCKLHDDKTPSGVIYCREQRWWCFACNRGGDVLDAVCLYEKIELHQAIAKLARYIGLDTKPLIRKPMPQSNGGAIL